MKQKAFCGGRKQTLLTVPSNAVMSLLRNGEDEFLNELVNIHVILLTLRLWLQLFVRRTEE